ncbi:4Fe-4S binding protein [Anaeromyxobacter oryzae]|uniref:4Fe-4S ferredoxin-type domain-containing protein n=1 Tax=Anaeromyxobacter oryzae TaxID=2918170 RepID=A0ABN6MYT0_9BACT|nr:4Fe-4S binding protein [Anaeromyxobacter oryzae]BDG04878.1 hypothetical protein AMOR_38740 [Anaeromyxobacter oryzae]
MPADAPAPRPRIAARGRPLEDPGCAGCAQLGLLRALRRAALDVEGGLGCDPAPGARPPSPEARRARLAGAAEALARPAALVEAARGRALLAIADRGPHRAAGVASALAAAGARVVLVPPDASPAEAERLVAAATPGAALVALVACARGGPRTAPLAVERARCNRCGACLGLGCVALSDPGGDAVEIDGGRCTGCGRCAPLCRAGAIAPRRADVR